MVTETPDREALREQVEALDWLAGRANAWARLIGASRDQIMESRRVVLVGLRERDALAQRVEALPEHLRGDGPCSRCGTADNPVWFSESVFWNAVVRSEPLPWCEGDGFMCINCFIRLTDERGYFPTGWRLLPEWHWETHEERVRRREAETACASCWHPAAFHKAEGCWYAVQTGRPDKALGCGCGVTDDTLRAALSTPETRTPGGDQ